MDLLGRLFPQPDTLWIGNPPGRAGSFGAVAFAGGRRVGVVASRIAHDGIVFDSPVRVRASELGLTFRLRRREIRSRVRVVREELVRQTSRAVHRYWCAFSAMAADDRAAIARYVDGVPEPDAAADPRVLSGVAVAAIERTLVRLERLEPSAGRAPLLRIDELVQAETDDGRTARDVRVTSRVRARGTMRSFETRLRLFDDNSVIVLQR